MPPVTGQSSSPFNTDVIDVKRSEQGSQLTMSLVGFVVLILVIVVVTWASPLGQAKYMAVGRASLPATTSSELSQTLRLSVELQTFMIIIGLTITSLFMSLLGWKSKVSMGIGLLVALLSFVIVISRSFIYEHLDVFFVLLGVLYLLIAVLSGFCAFWVWKTGMVTAGVLLPIIGAIFVIAALGAFMVARDAITGEDARKYLEELQEALDKLTVPSS